MKLKPQAKQEHAELERIVNYINFHPSVVGRFSNIRYGNLHPEEHEHPLLFCEGDVFLKAGDKKYRLGLTKNYRCPYKCTIGTYLTLSGVLSQVTSLSQIYKAMLQQLVLKQQDENLTWNDALSELGYYPLSAPDTEKQVDKFFSQARSIISLVDSHEVREEMMRLERTLSPTK